MDEEAEERHGEVVTEEVKEAEAEAEESSERGKGTGGTLFMVREAKGAEREFS